MVTLGTALPPEGIVLEQVLAGMVGRWSGVASTAMTTAGPDSMVRRGVSGGRVMMDVRRAVALSGAMVASTAGYADLYPEDGPAVDGSFESESMRRLLRSARPDVCSYFSIG
jgi:hypothetical protein